MPILVTGFGPFGGREENASSLVVKELRRLSFGIRTRILPVDAVLAPARLREAIRRIRPSAVVMLGEAGDRKEICLETMAWNEKNFRIPDLGGRMPRGVRIRENTSSLMASTLPLSEIQGELEEMSCPVRLSDDPGRYVCNLVFFLALDFLRREGMRIPAGFIHLPLESELATGEAVRAISAVIRLLGR